MLNTNGTLLPEERSRKFLKSGITRLRFSLDAATKETYEKVRLGGKYDVTMRNIENFLRIKKEENYQKLLEGKLGHNLLQTYNAKSMHLFSEWNDYFYTIFEQIGPKIDPQTHRNPLRSNAFC